MELRPDKELIKEYINTKSNEAAYILVEKYRRFVFSAALRYTKSYDDAEDLSQEVFMKAFENLHKFEFKSSLQTWLYRITVNTFLNSNKKRNVSNSFQREQTQELDNIYINDDNPEKELEYNQLVEGFEEALMSLPKRQREVFALRCFEDMKYEEISELLGLTVGGLKANYFHAIKKLSTKLKPFIK